MEKLERLLALFQVAASAMIFLFSSFSFVRTIVQHSGAVYSACFLVMVLLSVCLTAMSYAELKEMKGGKV